MQESSDALALLKDHWCIYLLSRSEKWYEEEGGGFIPREGALKLVGLQSNYHGLEAGVKLDEEGRLLRQRQHPFLGHGAFDVVVLNNDVLLQDLDGVQLICAFALSQHHLQWESSGWNIYQFYTLNMVRPLFQYKRQKIEICCLSMHERKCKVVNPFQLKRIILLNWTLWC